MNWFSSIFKIDQKIKRGITPRTNIESEFHAHLNMRKFYEILLSGFRGGGVMLTKKTGQTDMTKTLYPLGYNKNRNQFDGNKEDSKTIMIVFGSRH